MMLISTLVVAYGLLYVGGEMRLGWSSVRAAGSNTT